jgi:hypothetical protein
MRSPYQRFFFLRRHGPLQRLCAKNSGMQPAAAQVMVCSFQQPSQ